LHIILGHTRKKWEEEEEVGRRRRRVGGERDINTLHIYKYSGKEGWRGLVVCVCLFGGVS